jgi:hypothetical protein
MRFQGSALATVGSLIELDGVGAHFGGPVRASGVTHTIEAGGWTTEVAFGEAVEQPVALADAHGNSIRLNAAGITVKSAGQITLSATGSITVSASGQTTVKGSIVNIN